MKLKDILNEKIEGHKVICDNCGWSWNISDGGDDTYTCHKCGHDNTPVNKDLDEKWSQKYKRSIDCSHPKGFSQKAHCAGKKKNEDMKVNSSLNEKLNNNEYQMVDGIVDILNQIKDMSNRKEIADNMVQQFKDENIVFDYNKFYKAIGCNSSTNEHHHKTPNERIKSYTDRIKSIKDKMSTTKDKTSDTFKLQQGKLKAVTQTLLNYKKQQSMKNGE